MLTRKALNPRLEISIDQVQQAKIQMLVAYRVLTDEELSATPGIGWANGLSIFRVEPGQERRRVADIPFSPNS